MIVYHGSCMEVKEPEVNMGRFNLDFGKGFYVTTLRDQAEKWSLRRAALANKSPVVTVYEFDVAGLDVLTFDGYTEDWLNFVVMNRARIREHGKHEYDAIYGNIADDDVAATVDEYMRLLSINRVNDDIKKGTLYLLTFSKPNNQYCLCTQKAISKLIYVKSYGLED